MIPVTAANVAITYASEFDRLGLVLTTQQGSLLEKLTHSGSVLNSMYAGATQYDPTPEGIAILTNMGGDVDEPRPDSIHEIYLRSSAKTIAKYVAAHLSFARSKVRPLIESFLHRLREELASIPALSSYNPKITKLSLPLPMKVTSLEQGIRSYQGKNKVFTDRRVDLGPMDATMIMQTMQTGDPEVDAEINIWAAQKGDKFLETTWQSAFCISSRNAEDLYAETLDGADHALVIYLCAQRLIDNPPEGVNMSLGDYNSIINEIRIQAAAKLGVVYEQHERAFRQKTLIRASTREEVFVYANTYEQWVEEGGTDVLLYGNALLAAPRTNAAEILENRYEAEKKWQTYNAMLNAADINQRSVSYAHALKRCANAFMQENFTECFAYLKEGGIVDVNAPEYQQACKMLDEYCSRVKWMDFQDPWCVAKTVVADIIFHPTSAGDILSRVQNVSRENPQIAGREAALIATIGYVCGFISSMIACRPLGR